MLSLLFLSSSFSVSSFLRIQSETRFCIYYSLCYSLCHSHCYSLLSSLSLLLIAAIATHCCRRYSLLSLLPHLLHYCHHYQWSLLLVVKVASTSTSLSLSAEDEVVVAFSSLMCFALAHLQHHHHLCWVHLSLQVSLLRMLSWEESTQNKSSKHWWLSSYDRELKTFIKRIWNASWNKSFDD